MARAIQLARQGLYTTHPNPRVGCLLVKDGEVVGEGFHQRAGEPHAERNALAAAGSKARGATAYITLEPCCHQGRTPPCSQGLIDAGVERVVVAIQDPNPLVAGEGIAQLKAAGINVDTGLLEKDAEALNPGFILRMRKNRPLVRCKLAMSLDGRTAMASGESQWITGAAARKDVQRLRARSDAIVTGIGTLLADDPSMNVRLTAAELEGVASDEYLLQPLRVVLDPALDMPSDAKMLKLPGKTLVACCVDNGARRAALQQAGAVVLQLPGEEGNVDLSILMETLAAREINEVLIEAGGTLAGGALMAGVIDELIIYTAPHIMGDGGRGLFHLPDIVSMQERIELVFQDFRLVGPDLRITARPQPIEKR
ncbi:MAG: bifunctional diaminohydroxyphosphoribosylaminopyrimidine deaminase/5-amino-6-(5-phosphoribosylamino)uracil reductase RibD [Gammaproteobacteria bacterium]|nr:bifunctional diaminohydroxyphosphoribosylaminopyrimidine deaminase/5-amino-6-(5-phosphoribosylamino)uracil reductase RibD [Gammaproteobacteria bacterium]